LAKKGRKISGEKEDKQKKISQDKSSFAKFWTERRDVFKFLGGFLILMLVLFVMSAAEAFEVIREPLTNTYAWISSELLNLFSYNTTVNGNTLGNDNFTINIEAGCDGVGPMILFWTTIAVFPVKWAYKWKGLLYGTIFLFALNTIRVITLFLAGVYVRSIFEFLHVEVWQILFIAMTIFVWLIWYRWAQEKSRLAEEV